MTQEEKAKAYDEALERAKIWKDKSGMPQYKQGILDDIFPELKESEDERIRKEIISALKFANHKGVYDKHIAWLEKQESVEEIVSRCKTSWYNEGKVAGMAEGLTDDEKYQQGWHDALEKQGEQKPAWSEEDERLCSCLIKEQEESLDNVRNDKYGHSEIISDLKDMYHERIDWLESLKQRI